MPVAELSTRARPATEQRSLWGWGATARSNSAVIAPRDVQDVVERLGGRAGSVPRPVIARGAGRSYGDAAQLDTWLWGRGAAGPLQVDGDREAFARLEQIVARGVQ